MADDSNKSSTGITRRRMIGATGAGIATTLLAGCGGQEQTTTTTTQQDGGGNGETPEMNDKAVEVLHAWTGGDGAKAIEKLTTMFKEEYPDMPTNFRPIGGTGNVNLNSVIARRLANNNPPSSFQAWPGENIRKYEGQLRNITSVWEDNGYTESMNQKSAELSKQNGEYRSMPLGSHRMNNLFYNISVLEEAGVDPSSLTSVDAFIDALKKIDSDTDKVPMAHAMKAPWTNLQLFAVTMVSDQGMEAYEKWYKGNGDKAKVAAALEKTKEMLQYINNDASTISFTEANQKVMNGNAGVIHQGNWAYGMYRGDDSFNYKEHWDWIAFPGTEDMYMIHIDAFTFPEDTPTPVKSDIWAKFLGTKDAQVEFGNLKGTVPLRTDIDSSRLTDFLKLTADHLKNKPKQPPTLAHGLAVPPEQLGKCKSAIGDNFMGGSFEVDKTAQGLMDAVSE